MSNQIKKNFQDALDVLQNYTTYKRYFKILQSSEDDVEVPESKVM